MKQRVGVVRRFHHSNKPESKKIGFTCTMLNVFIKFSIFRYYVDAITCTIDGLKEQLKE